jgi:drug/metabolite transporter (DMT)-like permease
LRDQPQFSAYLALSSVCLFWGTTYLGIRIAVESLPPATLMCVRYLLSGTLMLAGARLRGARFPRGRELWLTAVYGATTIGLGTGSLAFAEQWLPSGLSALMITTSPFWLVGMEALMPGGEPLHAPTLGGMLVGVAGVIFLVSPGGSAAAAVGGAGLLGGFLLLQFGAAGWATGSILQRRLNARAHPFVSGGVQQLATGVAYIVPALLQRQHTHWTVPGTAAMLYLTVFGGIVGYSSYVMAMKRLPVAVASIYTYINPIIAVALGWLFYREPFGVREAAATAIIFVGVALVRRAQSLALAKA